VVVAPFSFLGLAAPDLRRRAGLLGVSRANGVTSEGESAVLEGFRVVATGRATLPSLSPGWTAAVASVFATGLLLVLALGLVAALVVILVAGLLVSSVARLDAGIQELLLILQGQPYSLTI
jgi:hypothetical protein